MMESLANTVCAITYYNLTQIIEHNFEETH